MKLRIAPARRPVLSAALVALTISAPVAAQIDLPDSKEALRALGREHATAEELYEAFKQQANGGQRLSWTELPDWSGIYSRGGVIFNFDPEQGMGEAPTAQLTDEYQQRFDAKMDRLERGIEFDQLSECAPPGHPRWLTEPFLREFVPTPDQTWLINEMVNDVRRVYTDGRGHPPVEDRYPLYTGDSIGFWDDQKLVVHTNQLMAGQYQRTQPDYSEQVETVEIWEKTDDRSLTAHVWVYDPPALEEPWYVRQTYTKLTDPEHRLRIRYWHCNENQNNEVIQTEEGSSQFSDFTFTDEDDTANAQRSEE